jgi:uncharacterized protein involved in exopolysaccharide biosynthesis
MADNKSYIQDEQPIHITDYYHILVKHKWTIIVSLVIIVGLAIWHNARFIPIYRANSTIIIDKESMRSPLTGQRMDYETYLSESMTFNTHFKLITSRPVLERVIKDLKLDQMNGKQRETKLGEISPFRQHISRFKKNIRLLFRGKEKTPPPTDRMTGLIQALRGMVNTQPIEETRLLNINVLNPDPVMARDVANAVAQAYIDFNVDNRLKSSQSTLKWLTDHLYEMKKELEDAEQEFLLFKQRVRLISPEESQRMIAQKMTDFNNAYLQARNRRLELNTKLKQLSGASASGGDVSHLRSLIASPVIETLYSQLINAEGKLSRLGKVYKPKHPQVVEVKTRIDDTRKKIDEEIKKETGNLKAERDVLSAKEKGLQKTMADFEEEAMETNKKELNFTILKRNVEMNQELYDTILSRLKEADITGNIDVSNIRITEKAVLPRFPISPNKKRNLILGIIVGLMIGIGISFFWEYLDRSFHTEDDVQKYLGLPVLSVIPLAEQASGKSYGNSKRSKKSA